MATITQRKSGKFQVKVRKLGYPVQSKSFTSKKTAQQWAKKVESEMEQGVFLDISTARTTLLSELLDRYEAEILPDKKSQQPVRSLIGTLKEELGKHNLASITPALLSRHREKRLKSVSTETARKDLLFLQRLFNTALKEWGINLPQGNPVVRVRLPSRPKGRDRRATSKELGLLCSDSTAGSLVTFAIETGMRRGEIASMLWKHINWTSQTLSIPITKTEIPRTIPLSNRAIETLKKAMSALSVGFYFNRH